MNGDELVFELREREKEKKSAYQVPIIGVKRPPLENVLASCKSVEMQVVLSKPLLSSQALEPINHDVYSNKVSTKPAKENHIQKKHKD